MGKTVKIFCMGDSLTEGDGNPSAYRYPLFELLFDAGADFRFVGRSSSRDDVRLPALYNHHGGNCGFVIGDDSDEGGGSLRKNLRDPDYSKHLCDADMVLLWIGANDYGQKLKLESITERYAELLREIWRFAPNASVYAASQISMFGYKTDLDKWLCEEAEEKFKKEGKRVVFVDLEPNGDILRRECGDFPEDDGHPSEEGNIKIAKRWFDAIIDEVRAKNNDSSLDAHESLVHPEKIELDGGDTLALGASLTLSARVYPENASVKTVRFKSSDVNTAYIDRYGRVFPKCLGEVTVTAETLDGKLCAEKKIKIEGVASDLVLGLKKVFASDLTNTALWDGDTDCISTKFNKFIVRYQGDAREISAKDTVIDSDDLLFGFVHRSANHGSRNRNNYSSVSVGSLELRICALASVVELYENGEKLGEYTGAPIAAMNDKFAVKLTGGIASVYRNGERLFCAKTRNGKACGSIKLYWHEYYAKSDIRNVEVYVG